MFYPIYYVYTIYGYKSVFIGASSFSLVAGADLVEFVELLVFEPLNFGLALGSCLWQSTSSEALRKQVNLVLGFS